MSAASAHPKSSQKHLRNHTQDRGCVEDQPQKDAPCRTGDGVFDAFALYRTLLRLVFDTAAAR
jgi:hypothetical protein